MGLYEGDLGTPGYMLMPVRTAKYMLEQEGKPHPDWLKDLEDDQLLEFIDGKVRLFVWGE